MKYKHPEGRRQNVEILISRFFKLPPTSHRPQGFTLIEMMVAVAIFSVVMLIGTGALLSLVAANKRAQALNSVMNNLNFAVETMSRTMRVGTTYYCQTTSIPPINPSALAIPQDCASGGGVFLAFEGSGGSRSDVTDQVVYRLNGTQLERSLSSASAGSWVAITAPDVIIESFEFYVVGSYPRTGAPSDTLQPRILMKIRGTTNIPGAEGTTFNIQASVTQRLLDI